MISKCTIVLIVAAVITGVCRVSAQAHFTFTSVTGGTATVVIPTIADPMIDALPLVGGDEIGAFTPAGLCVGAVIWTGLNVSLVVWMDDPQTPAVDGIVDGEVISYHIWDVSTGIEYYTNVAYAVGGPLFQTNGLYTLSSILASAPLPVELVSFTASAASGGVLLTWATATEKNNYGFDVERTAAGSAEWVRIGVSAGAGTTNAPQRYSYLDRTVFSGTYAYRLKQIDRDGTFEYSRRVEAAAAPAPRVFALFQNYPNPFNPTTTIAFDLPDESPVRLTVFDLLGRPAATVVSAQLPAGRQSVVFDAAGLSAGLYLYRLEAGAFTQVRTMMLVK